MHSRQSLSVSYSVISTAGRGARCKACRGDCTGLGSSYGSLASSCSSKVCRGRPTPLTRVGFLQTGLGSGFVLVGAGEVGMWRGAPVPPRDRHPSAPPPTDPRGPPQAPPPPPPPPPPPGRRSPPP